MKITALEEYGLRCMLQLAMSATDGPATVAQVAEREGLSTEYAGKLLNQLGQAGLVQSVRGRNGGFMLARGADEITLAAIVRALSNDLFDSDYCERHAGSEETCVHSAGCALRPVWSTISETINRMLDSLTLMDLLQTEGQVTRGLQPVPARMATAAAAGCGGGGSTRLHQLRVQETN